MHICSFHHYVLRNDIIIFFRLEAYDRNDDFKLYPQPAPVPKWLMKMPDKENYRDITPSSTIPILKEDNILQFLPSGDDINDKARDMYRNGYLRYVRSTVSGGKTFIHGNCKAQMRKKVSYYVDIKLDKNGVIKATQCECAAGIGPTSYCKHVQIMLLGIVDFGRKNPIHLEKTCTSQIQTFNHPAKLYDGSPVKCESFPLTRGMKDLLYNPEPVEYREDCNAYSARINNLVVNHAAVTGCRIPLLQLVPPANIRGYCNDHDYCSQTPESDFLKKLLVEDISEEQVLDIEKATRGQTGTKKSKKRWARERTLRLQSSTFGRICKRTDRTQSYELACTLQEIHEINTAPLRHGRKYESTAIGLYEAKTGNKVNISGIIVSETLPFLACSPDGVVNDEFLVEVKCPYTARNRVINPVSVPYLRYDENQNLYLNPDHAYSYQVQGQMAITGKKLSHFVIYTFQDLKIIEVPYDNAMVQKMLTKLTLFYKDFFRPALLEKRFYRNTDKYTFD